MNKFLAWDDSNHLDLEKALGNIAKLLVNKMEDQISHLNLVGVTEKDKLYYTRLATEAIYNIVFDKAEGTDTRRKLYTFLSTEGRTEVELDFSKGRTVFTMSLSHLVGFYKLELTRDDYISFGKNGHESANSIVINIEPVSFTKFITQESSERFTPHKLLNSRSETVLAIAQFLKELAKYGESKPIRIYGFSKVGDGYKMGTGSKFQYHPVNINPNIDLDMPGSNPYYYEIDPTNLDSFSLEHFRVFLGALFADQQGFFVKLEGMTEGQYLFAFDLFGEISSAPTSTGGLRPFSSFKPLVFPDANEFNNLAQEWHETVVKPLLDDNLMLTIHRYDNIEDWHSYLKLISFLNEFSSSFELLQ